MESTLPELINHLIASLNTIEFQTIQLNPTLKEQFTSKLKSTYSSSSLLVKSKIVDQFAIQNGKEFLIKHLIIDNTKNKPILINQTNYKDPFSPPIHPEMLIEDDFCNLSSHMVILTKFPLFKEQVLLVSREFVSQYTHLTEDNLRDLIILIDFLDGFGFFNGGMKAGASQPRKHLQAVPYDSLPKRSFGLFAYVETEENLKPIAALKSPGYFKGYHLNALSSEDNPHILLKFDTELKEKLKDCSKSEGTARIILALYHIALLSLGIDCENDAIEKNYSLLFTHEWMFVVLRKENEIFISEKDKQEKSYINLNSLAFFWIIVSRSSEQIREMIEGDIVQDVLSKL